MGSRLTIMTPPHPTLHLFEVGGVERLRLTNDGLVRVPDNGKFVIGAGNDFQIYHNGTNNILQSINGSISLQTPAGSEIQLHRVEHLNTA